LERGYVLARVRYGERYKRKEESYADEPTDSSVSIKYECLG